MGFPTKRRTGTQKVGRGRWTDELRSPLEVCPANHQTGWGGGNGINIHYKFVLTGFSLPSAKVFTGSSNHLDSGEKNNRDHHLMIEDRKVATACAIEAIRLFDHSSRYGRTWGGNQAVLEETEGNQRCRTHVVRFILYAGQPKGASPPAVRGRDRLTGRDSGDAESGLLAEKGRGGSWVVRMTRARSPSIVIPPV